MTGLRIRIVVAWVLAILLAISFLGAGFPKVTQAPGVVASFEHFGYTPWFARIIGVLEMAGGLLVLVPTLSFWGALLLVGVMFGAVYTHLTTGVGSPVMAATLLVMAFALASLRSRFAAFLVHRGKWD